MTHARIKTPSKHLVRDWLASRRHGQTQLPDPQEICRQLGWRISRDETYGSAIDGTAETQLSSACVTKRDARADSG